MEKETWYWVISIIFCLVIYKIVDMHTLQWFGDEWYIKSDPTSPYGDWGAILGFITIAALFWSIVALIIIPILNFFNIFKDPK